MTFSKTSSAILALLDGSRVPYRLVEHAPTATSEDSARARGEPLAAGAKALVLKAGDTRFVNVVFRATRRLDSRKARTALGVSKLRFASADELLELTGLLPGSVPPFGSPVLELPLYIDTSLASYPKVAFNAGDLCLSIILDTEDYLRVAMPEAFGEFTAEPTS